MLKKSLKISKSLGQIILISQKEKNFSEIIFLLEKILKKPKEFILAHPEFILSAKEFSLLKTKITRQKKGEPLAYILKEKDFFGIPFFINKSTLIPRPETEILVEKVLELIKKDNKKKIIIDVGTGSGCIIITLAKTLENEKNISFFGLDVSSPALTVARKNAKKILDNNKINFHLSDLLEIKNHPDFWNKVITSTKTEIIIAANLPYISEKEYSVLDRSVKNFEPRLALISGANGLDHYQKLFLQIKNLKKAFPKNSFFLFLEFGFNQKPLLEKLIKQFFPSASPTFSRDLAKKWRIGKIKV